MADEPDELEDAQAHVQEKRLLEELDRDGELAQLKELLALESTRDFLWRVLTRCHVYGAVYNKNFGDMAFAEGQRNIGLWLLSEICEADPGAEIQMKRKANDVAFHAAQKQKSRRRRSSATP
jgi:hypothetical protein